MKENGIPATFPATLWDRAWSSAIPDSIALHCMLSFSGRIDADRLMRAVRLTLDAEPILGCEFVERWFRPYWHRYDNLDDVRFCEVRASTDCEADMNRFFEARPDLPVRVLLLQGDSDLMCIKFDHRVGDGKALQEYAYLLADIYNRLGDDLSYVPVPNVTGSRSLLPIGKRFRGREKWRLVRHIVSLNRDIKKFGQWKYPVPPNGVLEYHYATRRLDSARVRAIFEYGCRHRATVSQVLLAAFYLAVYKTIPSSPDLLLPVTIGVDLRRHLPSTTAHALSNFVGNSVIPIDPRSAASLDAVVRQIQEQMKSQQKYLGLAVSFYAFEALPIVRHLLRLVPYGPAKRRRQKLLGAPLPKDHVPGLILLSNVGDLDHDRLVFSGAELIDAFNTGGVFKIPGLLGLGVCGFRGSLTLHLGCGPTELVTRLLDEIVQTLPIRSTVSARA